MKLETLNALLASLPENAVAEITKRTGKSKTTIYNVLLRKLHKNADIVKATIDIIETKAINDLKLVADAKRELADDEKPKSKPQQKQMKQAA